jgi:hypothetical protein
MTANVKNRVLNELLSNKLANLIHKYLFEDTKAKYFYKI